MCFQWVMVQRGAVSVRVFFILLSAVNQEVDGPIISYVDTHIGYNLTMLQHVARRRNVTFLCRRFCIESRVDLYFGLIHSFHIVFVVRLSRTGTVSRDVS